MRGGKSNQTSPDVKNCAVLGPACPAGWVGYEGKCYFFSEEERNWTSAQSFCISQGSSLAKIQSELEKVFMLRFKGEADHWIGLRKDFNDTWIWADGSEYSNILLLEFRIGPHFIGKNPEDTSQYLCSMCKFQFGVI
ncbi:C-type lectin domain family 2 member D-like isoform X2 [Podarcis muralis]